MRKFWTEEEDKILIELWDNENITIDDMKKVLIGRTESAITNRAARLKLPPPAYRRKSIIDYRYYKKLMEVIEG